MMQRVDHSGGPASSWDEDTIYCEATCQPEDVFYEGSEDDDYDSPTTRRLRYETAGQRFLSGIEPFLLTASLKGPFDKASGWVNPWRSKHRTTKNSKPITSSQARPAQQGHSRTVSIPETTHDETQNSLECHLPSPESLKQASVVDSHPYLKEDELVKVQIWRESVQPASSTKDRFWVTTPRGDESARKRKATGSEWLKRLASKRRRTSLMESGSVNTPVPRRSHTDPTQLQALADDNPTSTINSIYGQHSSSAARSLPRRKLSDLKPTLQEVGDDEDELMSSGNDDTPLASTQPNTSARRVSPRREIQPGLDDGANLEDELSQEQIAAAATLSSPVSQRTHPKGSLQNSSFQIRSSQIPLEQQSPTRRKSAPPHLTHNPTNIIPQDINDSESRDQKELEAFESQRDQSFCFKMRPKIGDDDVAAAQPSFVTEQAGACQEDHTWSGLSSENGPSPLSTHSAIPAIALDFESFVEGAGDTNVSSPARTNMSDVSKTSSSDLSSLLSRYFEGFQTPGLDSEDQMDVETNETTQDELQEVIQVVSPEKPDNVSLQHQGGNAEPPIAARSDDNPPAISWEAPDISLNWDRKSDNDDTDNKDTTSDSSLSSLEGQDIEDLAPDDIVSPAQNAQHPVGANPPSLPSGALLLKDSVRRFMTSRPSPLRRTTKSPATSTTKVKHSQVALPEDISTASEESSEEEDVEEGSDEILESEPESEIEIIPESPVAEPNLRTEFPAIDINATIHVGGSQQNGLRGSEESEVLQLQTEAQTSEETAPADIDEMEVDRNESQPLPVSQQSPWTGTKLSQFAPRGIEHLPHEDEVLDPAATPQVERGANTTSPEVQTPWAEDAAKIPTMGEAIIPKGHAMDTNSITVGFTEPTEKPLGETQHQNQDTSVTTFMTPRPSTPEPQFTVKSFASFMSPSPERRARQRHRASWRDSGSGLPSTQGILASALKNPWSARSKRSERRVSWKPLPSEADDPTTPAVPSSIQPSSQSRKRASSPPPLIPIADLPTSQDEKFHHHFKAILRRRSLQAILPTESQRTLGSPDPQAMAEKFLEADEVLHHHSDEAEEAEEAADTTSLPTMKSIFDQSQDPIDIVEDVFREMSDYLETWNVDTELDQARRESSVPTARVDPSVQSPW